MYRVSKRHRVAIAACVLLLVGVAVPALAQNQANAPAIVLQVRNVQELLDDVRYLAQTVGGPAGAGAVEGLLQQFAPEGKIPGVDETRPLGAVISFGQFGEVQMPVFFVPVRDQDAFRQFLKAVFPQEQKLQDDLYFYQSAEQAIYAKFTDGYGFLSLLPTTLESPPDVSKLPRPQRDIEVSIRLDRFPPELVTALDAQLQMALMQAQEAAPEAPATESERLAQELGQKLVVQGFKMLLTEAAELRFSLDVDRENGLVLGAFTTVARPDTGLASMIASLGNTRSRFAAIHSQDDFITLLCAMPLNKGIRDDISNLITQMEQDITQGADEDAKRALPLIRAVRECLGKTESIEFAAAARFVDDQPVLTVAGSLADPAAIRDAIIEVAKSDPKLTVKAAGPEITIKTDQDEELVIVFTRDAFYAAVARPGQAAQLARQAREVVESARPAPMPSFLIAADAKKIIAIEAQTGDTEESRQQAQTILEAIGDSPGGVHFVGQTQGNAYEFRIEIEEGVLKAIGVLATMAAAQLEQGSEVDPNVQ